MVTLSSVVSDVTLLNQIVVKHLFVVRFCQFIVKLNHSYGYRISNEKPWKLSVRISWLYRIYIDGWFFGFGVFLPFAFEGFRAAPVAYGSSQARGHIGAIATGLHHSHSNTGFELHLRPTPQLRQRQILNPLSKARDQTHILMETRQVRYRWATTGMPPV